MARVCRATPGTYRYASARYYTRVSQIHIYHIRYRSPPHFSHNTAREISVPSYFIIYCNLSSATTPALGLKERRSRKKEKFSLENYWSWFRNPISHETLFDKLMTKCTIFSVLLKLTVRLHGWNNSHVMSRSYISLASDVFVYFAGYALYQ